MNGLSADLWVEHILPLVGPCDLIRLSLTSKYFYQLTLAAVKENYYHEWFGDNDMHPRQRKFRNWYERVSHRRDSRLFAWGLCQGLELGYFPEVGNIRGVAQPTQVDLSQLPVIRKFCEFPWQLGWITAQGEIWAFHIHSPNLCQLMSDPPTQFVNACSANDTVIALDVTGNVYFWKGISDVGHRITMLERVRKISGTSCSRYAALLSDGTVLAWRASDPSIREILQGLPVLDIAAGSHYVFVLLETGQAGFVWITGNFIGRVEWLVGPEKFSKITAYWGHFAAITREGNVFVGDCIGFAVVPSSRPIFQEKIKEVALGAMHYAAISESGAVYTWGQELDGWVGNWFIDTCGTLGSGSSVKSSLCPRLVSRGGVLQVTCGTLYCATLLDESAIPG